MELTEKITGWFDVRKYKDGKPKEQWPIMANDDNISFTTTFNASELPETLREFAKPYDRDGVTRYRVSFKISSRCKWFDSNAQSVERPTNGELDGKRYEVRVQYNTVRPKDPNDPKAARGYWANAIQFQEIQDNPFEAFVPQERIAQSIEGVMPPVYQPQDNPFNGGKGVELPY